jgi:hypothetical protein
MRFVSRLLLTLAVVTASLCSAGVALASTGSVARAQAAARPAGGGGFSISLAASASVVFTGNSVTVTATTNADVGPTPYFISVYDETSQTELAVCGTGTTCSATVTESSEGTQVFEAYVGDIPPSDGPPGFIIVSSPTVSVLWLRFIVIPCPAC